MVVNVNKEMLEQGNKSVKDDIIYFRDSIEKNIDNLSKKSMRRLLKVYSGFSFANEIIGKDPIKLNNDENQLLKTALKLQEDCLGYTKFKEEINELPEGE